MFMPIFTARVCGKVMFSYCLSVCLSFQAITVECLDIETSFLVWGYILIMSSQVLVPRSLDQGQGHFCKVIIMTTGHQILLL